MINTHDRTEVDYRIQKRYELPDQTQRLDENLT